jgi:hypothetical protein
MSLSMKRTIIAASHRNRHWEFVRTMAVAWFKEPTENLLVTCVS